jgi:hypothetical protein
LGKLGMKSIQSSNKRDLSEPCRKLTNRSYAISEIYNLILKRNWHVPTVIGHVHISKKRPVRFFYPNSMIHFRQPLMKQVYKMGY